MKPLREAEREARREFLREYLKRALRETDGRWDQAAKLLQISRSALYCRLAETGLCRRMPQRGRRGIQFTH